MAYVRRKMMRDPWWHVAGLSLGLLFVLLLMLARLYPAELNEIDLLVEAAILPFQSFTTIEAFLVITALGGVSGIIIVGLGATFLLRRNRFAVLQLFLLLVFSSISMGIAKTFVERARPEALLWIDPLNTYSFPSGHATLSAALYGFLAVCLYRRLRHPAARMLAVLGPALLVLLICISRVVLNAHYLTDVIGGVLLGLFWLCVVFMLPRHTAMRH
jgi:undecaprenyl-diphosphatase